MVPSQQPVVHEFAVQMHDVPLHSCPAPHPWQFPPPQPPHASGLGVVTHWLLVSQQPDGHVVALQPTSPLRRAEHIDEAIELLTTTPADAVVSVIEVPHQFAPTSLMRLVGDRLLPLTDAPMVLQRQQKAMVYARNGPAVLVVRTTQLRAGSFYGGHTRALVMTPDDSVDVDTSWDFELATFLLARRGTTIARHARS